MRLSPLYRRIAGVLGSAISEAELAEEASVVDSVMCTEEAYRMYMSSSFQFQGVELQHQRKHKRTPTTNDASVPALLTKLYRVSSLGSAYPAGISSSHP